MRSNHCASSPWHRNLAVKSTFDKSCKLSGLKMDTSFPRVKSIVNRLREVLKCQKCFQMKEEESMILYHACDHFYCTDCLSIKKSCPLCSNPFDKPSKVVDDKNILSLYQSLKKFELPSKQEIDKIYKGHSDFKEEKLRNSFKDVEAMDVVLETPKHKSKAISSLKKKKEELTISNSSNFDTVILSSGENNVKEGDDIPTTSGKGMNSTPKRGRSQRNVSATLVTTPVVTPIRKVLNNTTSSCKGNTPATKTNVNKRNPKGETQLHLACKKANFSLMANLIAAGANPNAQDNAGWTPLHDSVFSGNLEVIKFLLDNGAKVNAPGLENTTALHEAIAKGNVEMVKLLLEYGADINALNIFRETPLDLVTKYKLLDMEKVLLETTSNKSTTLQTKSFNEFEDTFILYKYNLTVEDEKLANKFAEHFQAEIASSLTSKVLPSHIIIPHDKVQLTWTVISSVPNGHFVTTMDWVKDSLSENNLKPPIEYEPPSFAGFSRARKIKEQQLPGLFSGCHFFFGGNFEQYTVNSIIIGKDDLKNFVERNGGAIVKRSPDPESLALEKTVPFHALPTSSLRDTSYFIIFQKEKWDPKPKYNMSHMKTLPIEWLVCCILSFELIDPNEKESLWHNLLKR